MKLLVATGNAGKLAEIRALTAAASSGLEIVGLGDLPSSVGSVEIVEDADTFVGNARKKARTLHKLTGLPTLADDSGLVVEALGGQPGVHSARYAGPDCVDAENNAKLLRALEGVERSKRAAAFVCSMIFIDGAGQETSVEGRLEGLILEAPRGTGGFGYDPVFCPEGESRSVAEMNMEEKNRISHRGRALRAILPTLLSLHTEKRRP